MKLTFSSVARRILVTGILATALASAQEFPADFNLLWKQMNHLTAESRRKPNNLQLLAQLAELQMKSGEFDRARNTLDSTLILDNDFLPAVVALGQLNRRMFHFQSSLQQLATVLTRAPDDSTVQVFVADLAIDRMDYPTASDVFRKALRKNQNDTWALCGLANVAYWGNRYDEADKYLRSCLGIDSTFARAWLLKSLLHRIKQENNEWAQCGRRAVANDPFDDEARANLSNILMRGEKKLAEGYDQGRIALKLNPYNFTAHNSIGNGWSARLYPEIPLPLSGERKGVFLKSMRVGDGALTRHDLATATPAFDRALDILPDHIPALIGKGTTFYYKQEYDEALRCFYRALTLDPDYGLAHYGVAMCLLRKRDAVNVRIANFRQQPATDVPEPLALQAVFTNYMSLDAELQRIVRVSVAPLNAYLPLLKEKQVTFLIFPFHHFLWQMPANKRMKGTRTFDGRLWDDVKGSGGSNASAGEEWERDVKNFRFNVLTHEFAHQVHGFLPKNLKDDITRLYTLAKNASRTLDFYSNANEMEYFAVGVEAYVSEYKLADQKITYGHTREELRNVDPDLYEFVKRLNQLAMPKESK